MLLDHYFAASAEAIQRATAFGPKPEKKRYVQKSPFYFEGKASRDLPKLFQTDRYRWISDTGYDDLVARHYRGGHIGFEPLALGGAPQSGRYNMGDVWRGHRGAVFIDEVEYPNVLIEIALAGDWDVKRCRLPSIFPDAAGAECHR